MGATSSGHGCSCESLEVPDEATSPRNALLALMSGGEKFICAPAMWVNVGAAIVVVDFSGVEVVEVRLLRKEPIVRYDNYFWRALSCVVVVRELEGIGRSEGGRYTYPLV